MIASINAAETWWRTRPRITLAILGKPPKLSQKLCVDDEINGHR
jgi:hypothetical protein